MLGSLCRAPKSLSPQTMTAMDPFFTSTPSRNALMHIIPFSGTTPSVLLLTCSTIPFHTHQPPTMVLGSSDSASSSTPLNVSEQSTESRIADFVTVDLKLTFASVKARMPDDPAMMIHLEHAEASRNRFANPYIKARSGFLFAVSPSVRSAWTRIISLKGPRVDLRQVTRKHGPTSTTDRSIDFASDAIRIGVPHQLVVHNIFDNIINCQKTIKQLTNRFSTGTDEYILEKKPEGPKKVPKISIRTHILLFEIEDGAFEWKLGTIYRTGLLEQKQRLAREEAYRIKCRRLQRDAGAPSCFGSRHCYN